MDQIEADECLKGYLVACRDNAGGLYVFQPVCLSRADAEICQKRNEHCLFGTPEILEVLVTPGQYKKAVELQRELESDKTVQLLSDIEISEVKNMTDDQAHDFVCDHVYDHIPGTSRALLDLLTDDIHEEVITRLAEVMTAEIEQAKEGEL